jgi:glycosyltransferase involved in cell wall biosynthesis
MVYPLMTEESFYQAPAPGAGGACDPGAVVGGPPTFSIIMNVYNGEKYLAEAIASVRAQSFTDWELICWDDCSTDGSAAICQGYDDARIRYFPAPRHTAIGAARNAAIAQAGGQWLAFLDQDDLWAPTKLADQYALIQRHGSEKLGIVYGRTMRLDRRGRQRDFDPWHEFSRLPEGNIFNELIRRPSFVSLSSAVLLRGAVDELGGIPEDITYCPDYYLFVMVAKNYEAACLQDTCCWYRVHETNMSHIYKIPIHTEILAIIARCAQLVGGRTLARRQKVHNTLIGVEEICSGTAPRTGMVRILRQGSVTYLLGKAMLHTVRSVRRAVRR